VTISPIYNANNQLTNFVALKQHISNRKKLEKDLIIAKERAEESDRLKSAFLANMSHEIRTPLNSILGFSELLNDEDIDKSQRAIYGETIIENGNHLLTIVNDILDISKIETQQLIIHRSSFGLNELISDVILSFTPQAEAKPIALSTNIDLTNHTLMIDSDYNLLRRVLFNLVGNAIKFTEKGYVQIDYFVKYGTVEFRITDTGIGIDADLHDAIFERFRQAEAETTRKYGGTGLGLAISKKIVNLLGGEIWLESESGKGAVFNFTLPMNQALD
jgi:signal transduction histidine kinase